VAIVRDLAKRVSMQGGATIIFDYGHLQPGTGDTLQAMRAHGYSDPWKEPGEQDLTAHVDFAALRAAAESEQVRIWSGTQGEWLRKMGIGLRASALAKSAPDRAGEVKSAQERLTSADQMGRLFKVMGIVSSAWPEPAGFQ
jgi:SAM-dependent MidA family methyltransferase